MSRTSDDRIVVEVVQRESGPFGTDEVIRGRVVSVVARTAVDGGESGDPGIKVGDIVVFDGGPNVRSATVDGQDVLILGASDIKSVEQG
ncbi:hypothetical protein [Streptomyces sp. NPDC002082]|uniref:hypothetical protein n=1 Tax=Streptomyces sp. NPDC002082 TaxID=3154772 RepID=UPI00331738B2